MKERSDDILNHSILRCSALYRIVALITLVLSSADFHEIQACLLYRMNSTAWNDG